MSALPERINVMKVVSYDVADIVQRMTENDTEPTKITLWDVMQQIEAWIEEDFGCGFGHTADTSNLIFQDEDGDELVW